jgi:hypothetical protein
MDLAPDGTETDREYGTIGVDPGPPTGAVKGRWRFRPPCLPFGSIPTKPDKQCVTNINDTFLPPTREMRSVIEGLQTQIPGAAGAVTSANGIYYGQYHAPILEYIFPENIPGNPIVENNFNTIPFLACGGYTSAGDPSAVPPVPGTLAGVLNPWPSITQPGACAGQCIAPTPSLTASPSTAAAGTVVTLTASSGGTGPFTYTFAQSPTDPVQVALTVVGNTATFTAPGVANTTPLNFTVTVLNCSGTGVNASVTVTVNGASAPTVSYTPAAPPQVPSGTAFGPFTASCTDPNVPALTPCTFQWTQTAGANILNPNPTNGATIGPFTVTIPVGQPSQTFTFQVVATNTAGVSSAPELATITVMPSTDQVALTTSVYRFGKQRLDLTATDSVPTATVTLLPYLCQGGPSVQCPGGIFDPATLGNTFTNTGGGLYTFTIVGAPEPACNAPLPGGNINAPCTMVPLQVKSSVGGISPLFPLQKTRQ